MNVFRYETPNDAVTNIKGSVIFLAGPTIRGNQRNLGDSWRFEAIEIFEKLKFNGTLIVPEFTDIKESDKGRIELPIWEHNGLTRADCILFWIPRTRECWGLNTNSEHGYWLAKEPLKLVYGRPDDAYRIQYNDIMHHQIYKELGITRPIYNTLENTIKASIKMLDILDIKWKQEYAPKISKEEIAFNIGRTYYENNIHVNPYPDWNSEAKAWLNGHEDAKNPKKEFVEWLNFK